MVPSDVARWPEQRHKDVPILHRVATFGRNALYLPRCSKGQP
jgi:hypothetical protein